MDPPPRKYLTFALDKEEYAVPVLKVREIIKIMDITRVPQLPALRQRRHQPARESRPDRGYAHEVRAGGEEIIPSAPASSSSK